MIESKEVSTSTCSNAVELLLAELINIFKACVVLTRLSYICSHDCATGDNINAWRISNKIGALATAPACIVPGNEACCNKSRARVRSPSSCKCPARLISAGCKFGFIASAFSNHISSSSYFPIIPNNAP